MSKHLDGEQILDLVHGLVDDETRKVQANHVLACRTCAERVRVYSADLEVGRSDAPTAVASLARSGRRRPLLGRWAALAAAAVLVFFLVRPLGDDPEFRYVLPSDNVLETLRSANGDLPTLESALEQYTLGNTKHVADILAPETFHEPLETLRRIYLASALVDRGDAQGAIELLEEVTMSVTPEPWLGRARLVLAQAYLDLGLDQQARESLTWLLSRDDGLETIARDWLNRN